MKIVIGWRFRWVLLGLRRIRSGLLVCDRFYWILRGICLKVSKLCTERLWTLYRVLKCCYWIWIKLLLGLKLPAILLITNNKITIIHIEFHIQEDLSSILIDFLCIFEHFLSILLYLHYFWNDISSKTTTKEEKQ